MDAIDHHPIGRRRVPGDRHVRRRVRGLGARGERDAIHVNASVLTAASSQEIPIDELDRRQGDDSCLPDGAVYVLRTGPLSIRQDIYLDEQSNELLRASITSRISTEFSIRGLPSDDPRRSVWVRGDPLLDDRADLLSDDTLEA